MYIKRYMFVLLLISLLVTGCGNRGIPVIKQDLLDKKISVLMLTSPTLSEATKLSVGTALQQWRDAQFIAYDWIKDVNLLDEKTVISLKERTYDYIYVIGNELFPSANTLIQQGSIPGKWTFLQSQLDVNGSIATDAASLMQIDPLQVENLKNKWMKDLLASNVAVEWVTSGDHPIPSAWAPSEEADHIVLLDNNPQWFQQLAYQTRHHAANWIIFIRQRMRLPYRKQRPLVCLSWIW
ncbi:hypothetical protein [Paenibacillus sp. N3.4]|uniref:hypothetical protein n=1 Tax=Paenibacillus sp. N3.4 TaxID=2603222 RepID=UPI0011CC6995|nr:hypothetical protein [Paenibacillus sp. N3.4]TXK81921.1 hypothetical protein FU659_15430 [Paenibacillus sp. N3.4]